MTKTKTSEAERKCWDGVYTWLKSDRSNRYVGLRSVKQNWVRRPWFYLQWAGRQRRVLEFLGLWKSSCVQDFLKFLQHTVWWTRHKRIVVINPNSTKGTHSLTERRLQLELICPLTLGMLPGMYSWTTCVIEHFLTACWQATSSHFINFN